MHHVLLVLEPGRELPLLDWGLADHLGLVGAALPRQRLLGLGGLVVDGTVGVVGVKVVIVVIEVADVGGVGEST